MHIWKSFRYLRKSNKLYWFRTQLLNMLCSLPCRPCLILCVHSKGNIVLTCRIYNHFNNIICLTVKVNILSGNINAKTWILKMVNWLKTSISVLNVFLGSQFCASFQQVNKQYTIRRQVINYIINRHNSKCSYQDR